MEVTGIILAGGRSRRLGQDKALVKLEGRPLALWVVAALESLVQECLLVSNYPVTHFDLGLPLVSDLIPSRGALGGILTGIFFASTPLVAAVPCDTPFVQPDLLRRMVARARQGKVEVVMCQSSRGLEPLPAIFHTRVFDRLQEHLAQGDFRVRSFLSQCRSLVLDAADLDGRPESFFNINTPADLAQARQQADQRSA